MNTAMCKAEQVRTTDIAERVYQKLCDLNNHAIDIRHKLYGPVPENERSDEKDCPSCIAAFLWQMEIATDKIGNTLAEINERL
jgi:hypothetical protein